MGLTLLTNDDTQIIRVVEALYNQRPGSTLLGNFQSVVTADGIDSFANQMLANDAALTAKSDADLAAAITTNLGLTGDVATAGNAYLAGQFAANPAARGKVILDAMNALATLEGDATFGAAAATFNADIVASLEYSSVAANTGVVASDAAADATAAAAAATAAAALAAVGKVFSLTSGTDNLSPSSTTAANVTTAGDDTIYATTTGQFGSDIIDAGAGNDTLIASITANSQTVTPISIAGIETITITTTAVDTKALTVNATGITGADIINIKGAGAVSQAATPDELITVSNMASGTTFGIIGGTASTGATGSDITATWASEAATDTHKVAISTLGKVGVLTLTTATTAEITATGTGTTGANAIGVLDAGAVTVLNLKGAGDLTIADSVTSGAAITVNASASTGKISYTGESAAKLTFTGNALDTTVVAVGGAADSITTGAGNDTITVGSAAVETVNAGAGDDTVIIGATSDITVDDSIDGGAGTDTLETTDLTLNATDKTAIALGASNFEILSSNLADSAGTTTAATKNVAIDFNALSIFDSVLVAGAKTAQLALNTGGDTDATDTIIVTGMENTDTLIVSSTIIADTGGDGALQGTTTGGADAGDGGNAISLTPLLDNGSNVANVKLLTSSTLTTDMAITGGTGQAGADHANDTVSGNAGDALTASAYETLNIELSSSLEQNTAGTLVTADGAIVTFTAGTVGTKGLDGSASADSGDTTGSVGYSVEVGANATINLTSSFATADAAIHSSIVLGTIVGANVTLNGAAFLGDITAISGSGNTTLIGGAGDDTLTGVDAGRDTISGGAGDDIIDGETLGDILSGGTGRDVFVVSEDSDSLAATYDTIADFGVISTAVSASGVAAMSSNAAFVATATALGGANMDTLNLAGTSALEDAETVDIAAASDGTTVNGVLSAKGILTITGTDAATFNTLAELVDAAEIMLNTAADVLAFEFNSNTYVFQNEASDTDDMLIELTGVTGVTGIVIGGSSVAAVANDIFII